MNFEGDDFRAKYEDAVARNQTLKQQIEPLRNKCREIKESLCARELSDGSFEIDYSKLVKRLGIEGALELRMVIDQTYSISGEPGEKPKVRLHG